MFQICIFQLGRSYKFFVLPKWKEKAASCTLLGARVGGALCDGEQTLRGDRDLLFCRLDCE